MEGAHPTASGRLEGVALFQQSALLWQLRSRLFGLPAREFRVSSLFHLIGPWVVALLATLSQRGCNICFMSKDSELTRSSSNGLSSV